MIYLLKLVIFYSYLKQPEGNIIVEAEKWALGQMMKNL